VTRPSFRYVPYEELDDTPNVIVDGSANDHTTLTLSHWPRSGTPVEYRDDLSAQIVFRFLERPRGHEPAQVVSNNHYDEDGLVSVFALVDPNEALARRELLVDVASAGDLEVWSSRTALRVAHVITVLAEEGDHDAGTLYRDTLPRLVELCEHVDRFRPQWETPDAHTQAGLDALDRGIVTVDEQPDLDLAVVSIPERWASDVARRFDVSVDEALTNDALYPRTRCLRVLRSVGAVHRFGYRYESWVQLRSRRPLPRVALAPLAARLTELESGGAVWHADPINRSVPQLRVVDSTLAAAEVRAVVADHLARAEPAWSPYDEGT
jgi:hypothetical protein